jgi:hypothetical protein
MKTKSIYGLALIVGMVAGIVTMAFHPTGFNPHATAETVAHEMSILVAVHILALLGIPLLVFGFAGLTMRAGWHRPEALLAFIIYALSAVALMLAGIADGLINAALIPQMTGAIDPKLQTVKAALSYNFQLNQACAKVFVVGSSLAIILWSITLFRFGRLERKIGIMGWFISFIALAGLLSGHVAMSAHGFGLIVLLQAAWVIAVGISMLRAESNSVALTPDAIQP